MKPEKRIVIALPLGELWDERGPLDAVRGRRLGHDDIRDLLRHGPLQFVVAVVGHKLRWIEPQDCYSFWKDELAPRVCAGHKFYLEDYPGEHCFLVHEWQLRSEGTAIVCETCD